MRLYKATSCNIVVLLNVTLVQMRSAKTCRGEGHLRLTEVVWGHVRLRSNEIIIGHMRCRVRSTDVT